jgi:hypothetical protein
MSREDKIFPFYVSYRKGFGLESTAFAVIFRNAGLLFTVFF